jgi:hypothetical protein
MILQYAHSLRDRYRRDMNIQVEVRADAFLSLNYRPEQRYVDPDRDLAKEQHTLAPTDWILPFENTPLPSPVLTLESHLVEATRRLWKRSKRRTR